MISDKQTLINQVLMAFADMGASNEELAAEAEKLTTDENYLHIWCEVVLWQIAG